MKMSLRVRAAGCQPVVAALEAKAVVTLLTPAAYKGSSRRDLSPPVSSGPENECWPPPGPVSSSTSAQQAQVGDRPGLVGTAAWCVWARAQVTAPAAE
jgi:hypothetical protein